MPNGFHGSKERWDELCAPLRQADGTIDAFAARSQAQVIRDARGWPGRSIEWGSPVRRSVWIALADDRAQVYSVGVFATIDTRGKRYLRRASLKTAVPWAEIGAHLLELLEQGFSLVQSWGVDDLEYVLDLPER